MAVISNGSDKKYYNNDSNKKLLQWHLHVSVMAAAKIKKVNMLYDCFTDVSDYSL